MPKVILTEELHEEAWRNDADNALRGMIGRYLMQSGETREGLSERLCICRQTLSKQIKNPEVMTLGELRTIFKIVDASTEEKIACLSGGEARE